MSLASHRDSTASFSRLSNRASTVSTWSKKGDRKVVLITGASGGIGRATAVAFARTGNYDLALHYNSASEETRHSLLHAINDVVSAVIDVALFQADLSSYDAVRKLHQEVVEEFNGIHVLFANAGASGGVVGPKSLVDVPMDVFEQTWRINTGSSILLAQLCLPFMEQQGSGRIVFCSSVAALTGGVVGPHYASSKSALHGFVHWLGSNVAKKGITVNAVAPALVTDTNMLPRNSEHHESLTSKIPVGRLGEPAEIAETVLWLANVGYVTRKIITVDGGMHPC